MAPARPRTWRQLCPRLCPPLQSKGSASTATNRNMTEMHHGFRCKAIAPAMMISAVLLAASLARAQERGPLALAGASYFFVGGKIDSAAEGSPMVGHIYVEYMIPARRSHPYPIVMVHGGSQTGTDFTGTPDGRFGAVFRAPGLCRLRGRPGGARTRGAGRRSTGRCSPRASISSSSASSRPSADKQWPQAHLHTQWPGAGKRAIPCSISSTPRNVHRS